MHELRTDRLILRPLAESDAADLFAARRDTEVMFFWDGPTDATPSDTELIVGLFISEMRAGHSMYWAIRRRDDNSFVGICDLGDIRAGESADIGFMLVRDCWGVGFGGEVVGCLLAEAQSRSLRSLTARIHAGNRRSERLLMRAGFCLVNETRRYEIRPGVFRHCLWLRASLPT